MHHKPSAKERPFATRRAAQLSGSGEDGESPRSSAMASVMGVWIVHSSIATQARPLAVEGPWTVQ
jgi:hypothetical protein